MFLQSPFQISSPHAGELGLKILVPSKSGYDFTAHVSQVFLVAGSYINFLCQSQLGSLAVRHGTISLCGDYVLTRAEMWAADTDTLYAEILNFAVFLTSVPWVIKSMAIKRNGQHSWQHPPVIDGSVSITRCSHLLRRSSSTSLVEEKALYVERKILV